MTAKDDAPSRPFLIPKARLAIGSVTAVLVVFAAGYGVGTATSGHSKGTQRESRADVYRDGYLAGQKISGAGEEITAGAARENCSELFYQAPYLDEWQSGCLAGAQHLAPYPPSK
ncbi:hypothetical protein OG698_02220 [Streptomyces sp. NBC_01003]|uniref:hypothetical protein n=1 Tax=Streptomyces sp. NBC_01003 TaxID=2903714 RepID=UPI00386BC454|nr:hypothetical protein OG698_02220 [Streptomyces sp. NBC_01003]